MTPEEINAIAALPVMGVLIYVIIRQQGSIDKLLATITSMAEKHALDMIEMACAEVGKPMPATGGSNPEPLPHPSSMGESIPK